MEEPDGAFPHGEGRRRRYPPPLYLLNKETEVGYELPSRRDNYLPHQRRYI